LQSTTAMARAGVLNVITRWIARATAKSAFAGAPSCDFRSVGTTRNPRASRFVAEATSVRSGIWRAPVSANRDAPARLPARGAYFTPFGAHPHAYIRTLQLQSELRWVPFLVTAHVAPFARVMSVAAGTVWIAVKRWSSPSSART